MLPPLTLQGTRPRRSNCRNKKPRSEAEAWGDGVFHGIAFPAAERAARDTHCEIGEAQLVADPPGVHGHCLAKLVPVRGSWGPGTPVRGPQTLCAAPSS